MITDAPVLPYEVKVKAKNEDDDSCYEIRRLQKENDLVIELEIETGDTLQSLSLKYNVPIAELKRVNNILRETEFFAMTLVKIPVKPFSILAEQHGLSNIDKDNDGWSKIDHLLSSSENMSSPILSDNSGISSLLSGSSISGHLRSQNLISKDLKKSRKMFKNVDKDIDRIRKQNESMIVSTVIENRNEIQESETEDENEDDLLIPNSNYNKHVSTSNHHVMWYAICCGLILVSVLLIFWMAKHKFESIGGDHSH